KRRGASTASVGYGSLTFSMHYFQHTQRHNRQDGRTNGLVAERPSGRAAERASGQAGKRACRH
ncbi:hypothetical protein GGI05_006918, partial [Coemansia sp. RSA 2603]